MPAYLGHMARPPRIEYEALVAMLCEEAYGYRGRVVAEALGYRSTSSVAACLKRIRGSTSLMSAYRRLVRLVHAELGG